MKKEVPLGKRKMYDDEFKARVALEATKGEKTIAQVSAEYKVHPKEYESILECKVSLREYLDFYNNERCHQALDYCTPAQVHLGQLALKAS